MQHHIDGEKAEAKALNLVFGVSKELGRGQKIFHGVHVTESKLTALAKIFGSPKPTFEEDLVKQFSNRVIQLEIDAVIVDKNFIGLVEVKNTDSTTNGKKAADQLKLETLILQKILEIISVNQNIPVKKFIYFSSRDQKKPTFSLNDTRVQILRDYTDKEGNQGNAKQHLKDTCTSDDTSGAICVSDRRRLIAALAFLRFSKVVYKVRFWE